MNRVIIKRVAFCSVTGAERHYRRGSPYRVCYCFEIYNGPGSFTFILKTSSFPDVVIKNHIRPFNKSVKTCQNNLLNHGAIKLAANSMKKIRRPTMQVPVEQVQNIVNYRYNKSIIKDVNCQIILKLNEKISELVASIYKITTDPSIY